MIISWVDILILFIFIVGIISGKKKQIIAELIILIGVMCATFVAVHFYLNFAILLNKKLLLPSNISEIIAFLILCISIIFGFRFIQEGWSVVFKAEIDSSLEKFLIFIVSGIRMYLICGLIFLALLISGNSYVENSARKSLSAKCLKDTSSTFYKVIFNNVVSKFFPDEKINSKVFAVIQREIKTKSKR